MRLMFIMFAVSLVLVACTTPMPVSPIVTPTSIPPTATPAPVSPVMFDMIEPGGRIGDMVLTTAQDEEGTEPQLFDFCDPNITESDPTTITRECQGPAMPYFFIGYGIFADTTSELDELWSTMTWELIIDGHPVDLTTFGTVDLDWGKQFRFWNVVLENPTRGEHTIRYIFNEFDKTIDAAWVFTVTSPPASPPAETGWWSDAVFYEVFVRSFYDSNDDGIGDLLGLIQKLDYLNDGDPSTTDDLGVTGIWLMPIAQSPSYHGYDVVDYYTVEQDYGSNGMFQRLMDEAHARDISVIVDLVLNHTSASHPWFLNAGPSGEYRDWYVWSDENPGFIGPWGQQVWYRRGDAFYYAIFWDQMPDLNYRNPEVTAEMTNVARFWLEEMGADGFRIDAVRHLIEDGEQQESTPATHAWLVDFDQFTDEISPDVLTVGEVWAETSQAAPYVIYDEMDLVFEFSLAEAIIESVTANNPTALHRRLETVLEVYPPGQFATFLTNHDQDRVMNQVGRNLDKAHTAATILLTLPGVPFIYYGEEIGMTGQKPDEMIRTPMQWSAEVNAGFTSAGPWERVNDDYEEVNVAAQADDLASLLNHYRRMIHLRNDHIALRRGTLILVDSSCAPVYAYMRYHEEEMVFVLINFGPDDLDDCTFSLAASNLPSATYTVHELLTTTSSSELTVNKNGGFQDYAPEGTLNARGEMVLLLSRQ